MSGFSPAIYARFASAFILRDWLKRPAQTGLTLMGIALGVAVFLAINLANYTVLHQFEDSVSLVAGQTNLEVVPTSRDVLDESILSELTWLWDLDARFTPIIEGVVIMPDPPYEVVHLLGVDLFADHTFRNRQIRSESTSSSTTTPSSDPAAPSAATAAASFAAFQSRHVFVGESLARKYQLKTGQTLEVLISDHTEPVVIEGILEESGVGKAYGGQLMVADLSVAQDLLAMKGMISRVDVMASEDQVTAIQQRFQDTVDALGIHQAWTLQRPQRRNSQVTLMLQSFQMNLTALSFVGLLVGMFLIYNTMSITIIQRRSEIGTLRALGMSQLGVFCVFLVQAMGLGFIGALLGVAIGVGVAFGALTAVSSTVQTIYDGHPVMGLTLNPLFIFQVALVGFIVTVLAALPPITEALRVQPAISTRKGTFESQVIRWLPHLLALGAVLFLLAWILASQPLHAHMSFPWPGYAASLLAVLATACFIPGVVYWLSPCMASVSQACFGVEGRLAVSSLKGALGRTSMAAASLMVAIAMMLSLAVMIGSFRQTVVEWVNQTLKADLLIQPAGRAISKQAGGFSEETLSAIAHADGVLEIDRFLQLPITYNNRPAYVGVADTDVLARRGQLKFVDQQAFDAVMHRLQTAPSCIVSESFAFKHQVHRGNVLTLDTPGGQLTLPVEGVYYDYSSEHGYIIVPRPWYEAKMHDDRVTSVAVFTMRVDPDQVKASILKAVSGKAQLLIQTNRSLRSEVLKIFDNTFAITYALHVISMVVAVLAVTNTLVALVADTRKQLGLLQYLGAGKGQLVKIVLIQAFWLGVLGCVFGVAIGLVLSWLLVFVINKQSFGWSIQWLLPVMFMVQMSAAVMLASLIAAGLPARMAVNTLAPEVIRYE